MYRTVLIPLDGSDLAERALPYARFFVQQPEARLVLIRVVPGSQVGDLLDSPARLQLVNDAQDYLTSVVPSANAEAWATAVAYYGDPASLIDEEAIVRQADLVIMSTHGRSGWGQWIYGSVAASLLHRLRIPVLLVSPRCAPPSWSPTGPRILLPVDGSDLSSAITQPVIDLIRSIGGEIRLVRVVGPPMYSRLDDNPEFKGMTIELSDVPAATGALDRLAADFHSRGIVTSVEVQENDDPVAGILQAAVGWPADLIVMATHGHGGLARLAMGSVAQGVVQKGSLPVLAVRPTMVQERSPATAHRVTVV